MCRAIKGAIISLAREAYAKMLTLTHKVIDHAHNSPDNNELNGFTKCFKLDTIVSVMAVVLSCCRTSKD